MKILTVIECFGRDPIVNIATCLSLKPDTLVLVGEIEDMENSVENYRAFFKHKFQDKNVRVIPRYVNKADMPQAVLVLSDIVELGDNCVFDLWGGEEHIIAAAGIVYERYKATHNISMQQFNPENHSFDDVDRDGFVSKGDAPKITVNELISLFGGKVVTKKDQYSKYSINDIAPIWNMVRKNPREWNKKTAYLNEFEKHAGAKSDTMNVRIDFSVIKGSITGFDDKKRVFDGFMRELAAIGAVKIHSNLFSDYRYSYKNALVGECLNLAGNMLEFKTFFEGMALKQNGKPFFNSCLMGVKIDWDGILHNPSNTIKDTENEIDCIFMHGLVPVFISCKNGTIEEAEPYKLNTVAERFGGKIAKKMLLATNFQADSEATKMSVMQRCKDMGIKFVPNVAQLDSKQWQTLLTDIFKN